MLEAAVFSLLVRASDSHARNPGSRPRGSSRTREEGLHKMSVKITSSGKHLL